MPTSPAAFGPYHRRSTPTQTEDDAKRQLDSGEVWGRRPRADYGLDLPQVKAFAGHLPDGKDGIEFWTDVGPSQQRPGEVRWFEGDPGVESKDPEYVAIRVVITVVQYGGLRRNLEQRQE